MLIASSSVGDCRTSCCRQWQEHPCITVAHGTLSQCGIVALRQCGDQMSGNQTPCAISCLNRRTSNKECPITKEAQANGAGTRRPLAGASLRHRRPSPVAHCRSVALSHSLLPNHFSAAGPCASSAAVHPRHAACQDRPAGSGRGIGNATLQHCDNVGTRHPAPPAAGTAEYRTRNVQ